MLPLKLLLKQTFNASPHEPKTRDMRWAVFIIWLILTDPMTKKHKLDPPTTFQNSPQKWWVILSKQIRLQSFHWEGPLWDPFCKLFRNIQYQFSDIDRREIKLIWLSYYPLCTALENIWVIYFFLKNDQNQSAVISLEAELNPKRNWMNWERKNSPKIR